MKLAINRCFGGFGTSKEADDALRETACEHVERPAPERHYGYDHNEKDKRTCPHLLAVVEKMGTAADGMCAQLKVIEVPDGVDFEIDEYDGIEHIAEAHRTWP
jgi:hypothetical protein